jgi:hypothetical protein
MIPADCWLDNGDGTGWWVLESTLVHGVRPIATLDRPCDTCDGRKVLPWQPGELPGGGYCPKCIDGRHTFEIEVSELVTNHPDHPNVGRWQCRTLRVSIGMVLEIVREHNYLPNTRAIEITDQGLALLHHPAPDGAMRTTRTTLPSAAAPGMFAVLVNIAPEGS